MNSPLDDFSLLLNALKSESANARLVAWSGRNGSTGFTFFDSGRIVDSSNEFLWFGQDKDRISFVARFNEECSFGFGTDLDFPSGGIPTLTSPDEEIDRMLSIVFPSEDVVALFTVKPKELTLLT